MSPRAAILLRTCLPTSPALFLPTAGQSGAVGLQPCGLEAVEKWSRVCARRVAAAQGRDRCVVSRSGDVPACDIDSRGRVEVRETARRKEEGLAAEPVELGWSSNSKRTGMIDRPQTALFGRGALHSQPPRQATKDGCIHVLRERHGTVM